MTSKGIIWLALPVTVAEKLKQSLEIKRAEVLGWEGLVEALNQLITAKQYANNANLMTSTEGKGRDTLFRVSDHIVRCIFDAKQGEKHKWVNVNLANAMVEALGNSQNILDFLLTEMGYSGAQIEEMLRPTGQFTYQDLTDRIVEQSKQKQNPFKGLEHFTKHDKNVYFCKDDHRAYFMRLLSNHIPDTNIHFITGLPGCGKSSFARAGVVAPLTDKFSHWLDADCRISSYPARAIVNAISGIYNMDPEAVHRNHQLFKDPNSRYFETVTLANGNRILLLIDHFEELFADNQDKKEVEAVMAHLTSLAKQPPADTSIFVLACVRSDLAYKISQQYKEFYTEHFLPNQYELDKRFDPLDYKGAIVNPLRKHGKRISHQLVDELLKQLDSPTKLPLLQLTLKSLWENSTDEELNMDEYKSHGPTMADYLKNKLNKLFEDLEGPEQNLFISLMKNLVHWEGSKHWSKRQLYFKALQEHKQAQLFVPIIDRLIHEKFIRVIVREEEMMLEIVHECIFHNWEKMEPLLHEVKTRGRILNVFETKCKLWEHFDRDSRSLLSNWELDLIKGIQAEVNFPIYEDAIQKEYWETSLDALAEHS